MFIFWIICALLILLALWFVLPPLLQRGESGKADELRAANILVYQDQFQELAADLRNGLLSEEDFQNEKDALERRLLLDTEPVDVASASATHSRADKAAYVAGAAIPIAAIALYFTIGNSKALSLQAVTNSTPPFASQSGEMSPQQIQANVDKLAKRLEQNPNDVPGWTMLGRSYMSLERYSDAASAYARATALNANEATLWADYGEALALANGRNLSGKPLEAVDRALQIDPRNEKALALAGSGAFEVGDYQKAIDSWQKLLPLLPVGSDAAKTVSDQIAKAKELAAGRGSR